MSLHDHYSDGQYLPEGWHDVTVTAAKDVLANSGTSGVEFAVMDRTTGRGCRATFWITEKAVWRLAQFAHACGMTEDEMKRYDENDIVSHRSLINRRLKVFVEKGEKYHDVTDWAKLDDATPVTPPAAPAPPAETNAPDPDGISF